MKKLVRILTVILCLVMLLGSICVFAAEGSQGEWRTDADGKERYYVGGNFVTGVYQVGSHPYVFAADGECLGAYDGYTNGGTAGVMDTQTYKDAVAAKSPVIYETFDVGRTLDGNVIPEGGLPLAPGDSLGGSFGNGLQTVRRGAVFGSVVKNGTDLAYTVYHNFEDMNKYLAGYAANDPNSTHTYMDRRGLEDLGKNDYIIEFDLRLDNLSAGTVNLVTVHERGAFATDGFDGLDGETLLSVNNSGYVYSPKLNNRLIAKVYGTDAFTRISLSVHPSTNTYDIYCNGIKVLTGLTVYDNATQAVEDFQLEECRMFEIGSNATTPNTIKIVLDNMAMYNASEPVCLSAEAPKNGFIAEGAYLRYYENGCAVSGRHSVTGNFFGQQLNNVYTVFESGNGAAFIGYKATVTNGGVTVSSGYVDMNRFVAPKAVDMDGKHFIAWNVGGQLVEPGYSTRIGSDLTAL